MYRLLTAIAILLIWSACANRVPPTGGPKDETPPKLIASIPKDGNTNVRTREITLLFDELVVTKNIKKELLITPRIDFDYEYKTKKNTIILTLEESLDSATTYTFNFRKSLVDITEANPAVDMVLAFSTGPILDTLELSGNINELFTEKPVEELMVGLYKANDTLNLFNSPPYYLAQTDEKGDYLFRNLKPGTYVLNALKDGNNNLICESGREAYAFLEHPIQLDSTMIADTLKLHSLNIDTLQLKRTRNSGQYFIAVASKYLTSVTLKAANDSTLWYALDKEHKEIKVYNTFNIKDSLLVKLSMTDSLNSSVIDTFYLKFPASERKYDTYDTKLSKVTVFPETRKISFNISTSKPSKFIYKDSIYIKVDTLATIPFDSTWNITINPTNTLFEFSNYLPQPYLDSIHVNDNVDKSASRGRGSDRVSLSANINDKAKVAEPKNTQSSSKNLTYALQIAAASFQSVESDSSKLLTDNLKPKYAKDFGILIGEINTSYTHYFIQLIDENFKVINEIPQADKYKFTNVIPGDYLIRILIDSNKNGKWDAGNILLNQLPEPIIIYKNEEGISKTSLRANWIVNFDLTF